MSVVLLAKIQAEANTQKVEEFDSKLKQVEKTGQTLGETLTKIAKVVASGFAFASISKFAEDFGEMSGLLSSTSKRMNVSLKEMQNTVKETASALHEDATTIAKLYSSSTLAVQSFGGSANDAENIVKSLTASLKLSGTTASKTTMVLEQASKMFASGEVNSRAFLSIAVEAPVLFDKLAQKFNMSAKEMKKALEEGTISTKELLQTVGSFSEELVKEVQKGPMNMSHFFTQIKNEALYFFGEIEEGTQILSSAFKSIVYLLRTFLNTIRFVVDGIGGWTKAVSLLVATLIILKSQQIGSYMMNIAKGGWSAAKSFIGAARAAMTFKNTTSIALKSLGIGIAAYLGSYLIEEFLAMGQGKANVISMSFFVLKEKLSDLGSYISSFFSAIWSKISPLLSTFKSLGRFIPTSLFGEKKDSADALSPSTSSTNNESTTVNNNQQIKIDIKTSDPVQAGKEVNKVLSEQIGLTKESLTQRAKL